MADWTKMGQGFWNLCPVVARHGNVQVIRTANGGLLGICEKCWVGSKSDLEALKEGGER